MALSSSTISAPQSTYKFKCETCAKCFRAKYKLNRHQIVHTGAKPFKCTSCPKTFGLNRTLKIHLMIHTNHKPFKCPFCPMAFHVNPDLFRHLRRHTGERQVECQFCHFKLYGRGELHRHIRRRHNPNKHLLPVRPKPDPLPKIHLCSGCDKLFGSRSGMLLHLRTHIGEKPHQCGQCGKAYTQANSLKLHHLRTHTTHNSTPQHSCHTCRVRFCWTEKLLLAHKKKCDRKLMASKIVLERLSLNLNLMSQGSINCRTFCFYMKIKSGFGCAVCDLKTKSVTVIKDHMNVHTKERPYGCSDCHKTFTQRSNLNSHMLRAHGRDRHRRKFQCTMCDHDFKMEADLKMHMKRHLEAPSLKCSFCDKFVRTQQQLRSHEMVHTGVVVPYKCSTCPSAFRSAGSLRVHRTALHNAEKSFKCSICDKDANSQAQLMNHIRQCHTGERPFVCTQPGCKANYATSAGLTTHRKSHVDKSEWIKCSDCGKIFSLRAEFNVHFRRVHLKEKGVECTICAKEFFSKKDLKLHNRAKHPGE